MNKYEYLFGQKRINAENLNSFFYYYFFLLLLMNFVELFWGVGRGQNWFLKNVFSVLLNKRKKRYFQADHPKVGYLSGLSTEMKTIRTILLKSLI